MIEYKTKTIPSNGKDYLLLLQEMGKENWDFKIEKFGLIIFSRRVVKNRKTPVKKEEKLWYNKDTVKGLCGYAFDEDFVELYSEWREERKLSKSYKTVYNEASEKRTFNKLSKFPKEVAKAMLNNAIASKWLILYDLDEREKHRIIEKLQIKKKKQEELEQGFKNEEEKKKAEVEAQKISSYLSENPQIKQDAIIFVKKKYPSLTEQAMNVMAETRAKMEARKILFKKS